MRILLAAFVLGQAALLMATGLATFWWSQELMGWLIWMIGEERALGAQNVIRLPEGGALLTNPGAMIFWTTPFWAFGLLQITAAFTLVGLWLRPSSLRGSAGDSSPAAR